MKKLKIVLGTIILLATLLLIGLIYYGISLGVIAVWGEGPKGFTSLWSWIIISGTLLLSGLIFYGIVDDMHTNRDNILGKAWRNRVEDIKNWKINRAKKKEIKIRENGNDKAKTLIL